MSNSTPTQAEVSRMIPWLSAWQTDLNNLILRTPTGEARVQLTEANIHVEEIRLCLLKAFDSLGGSQ